MSKEALKQMSQETHNWFNEMYVPKEEYEKMKAFCEWVASEVTNEESWGVNSDSFAEIACRKLHKLGIVDKQGDSWVYKE